MAASASVQPAAKVRWGIISTASIARKNVVSIQEAANAEVVCVGSRSIEKARAFAAENAIPAAVGSYEEVLEAGVDAVYIPLPTGCRLEWVKKAAAAGKHVLCEKPIAPTLAEAFEMTEACRAAGVLFMDGTMFEHHTRLAAVTAELPKVGRLSRVVSSFSFSGGAEFEKSNIRMGSLEPLGCLGDLGWYNARLTLWAFGWELPTEVSMHVHRQSDDGVPTDVTCTLRFSGNRLATFDNSFFHALRQRAEFVGDHGTLSMDDFCVPEARAEAKFAVTVEKPVDRVGAENAPNATPWPHLKPARNAG